MGEKRFSITYIFIFIIIGVIVGAIFVSNFDITNKILAGDDKIDSKIEFGSNEGTSQAILDLQATGKAFVEISKRVTPAIVSIRSKSHVKFGNEDMRRWHRFFGPVIPEDEIVPSVSLGSGVIVNKNGYVITNNHVVEGANDIEVILSDRRSFYAKIIGFDPFTDLALIQIDGKDLPVAPIGDSDSVEVGEWVLAIGNPLGLNSTVTAGIISAIGRDINIVERGLDREDRGYSIENFIQTDAAINPGNSGGALVNLQGKVIGINTAIATQGHGTYIGYGFAIPINLVNKVMKDFVDYGYVRRGWIGVQIRAIDQTDAKAFGLNEPRGVLIVNLVPNGAAKEAGLKEEDIILEFNGFPVNQANKLQELVARHNPGDEVTLHIYRNDKEIEIKVTLKEREKDKKRTRSTDNEIEKYLNLGISVQDITQAEADRLGYNGTSGVLVTGVSPGSVAADRGLRGNAIILEINREKVNSVKEYNKMLKKLEPHNIVLFRVWNVGDIYQFVSIEIPENK